MRHWGSILIAGLLLNVAAQAAQVGLIKIDGAIGPATASYISRAIDVAAAQNDECLIIQLDTPGGLLESTKQIVESLFAAKIPTAVYVTPSGASAASAGTFITLAADVAVMAPNTTIGAAHPVEMGLGGINESTNDVMRQKLENYGSSFMETIADKRHRNVDWAKSAVAKARSTTAEQALNLKVIDLIARTFRICCNNWMAGSRAARPSHGKRRGRGNSDERGGTSVPVVLAARGDVRPDAGRDLRHHRRNQPSGRVLPGVAGAMALILVLYMSAILPVNAAGVALILLAVALFIVDIFAPTHGVLTAGGIVAFFLGALMLFNHAPPGFHLSLCWIIPATARRRRCFLLFVVGAGLRAQWLPVRAGQETMIGQTVTALSRIDPSGGRVFIEGEYWNAVSDMPDRKGATSRSRRHRRIDVESETQKPNGKDYD